MVATVLAIVKLITSVIVEEDTLERSVKVSQSTFGNQTYDYCTVCRMKFSLVNQLKALDRSLFKNNRQSNLC